MNLKVRLSLMNFLEFAVWGAYLTCMGNYLGIAGLGDRISWFYAIQGIVSIFMPTLMGIVADKYIQPQRLLGLCHLVAGAFMISCWWLGAQAGFGQELTDKSLFIALYTLSVAFYMPTIALTNTTAFTILKNNGLDTVKDFPPIRVLGTVGFIATMWFVNCAFVDDTGFGFTLGENAHKFQYTYLQFLVSGILSIVLLFEILLYKRHQPVYIFHDAVLCPWDGNSFFISFFSYIGAKCHCPVIIHHEVSDLSTTLNKFLCKFYFLFFCHNDYYLSFIVP